MAPREEIIASAISFLQDPSVASSPTDKRIAFLRSKNLTQEEIDIALARAGTSVNGGPATSPQTYQQQAYGSARPASPPAPGYGYGYGYQGYPGAGPWQGQYGPPRRDWRDWFIMATVTSGIGWGLYTAAQRYVMPLIRPPTEPQLEQDKAAIDASFDKAFALIEQLAADTAEIKAAEAARTEKLDATIREVDAAVAELKAANSRREADARVVADQVNGLRDLIPRSLESWKRNGDGRLDELAGDLASLKRLLETRAGLSTNSSGMASNIGSVRPTHNGTSDDSAKSETEPKAAQTTTDVMRPSSASTTSFSARKPGSRASIPAWQMAAANNKSNASDTQQPSGSAEVDGSAS